MGSSRSTNKSMTLLEKARSYFFKMPGDVGCIFGCRGLNRKCGNFCAQPSYALGGMIYILGTLLGYM